MPLLLRSVRSNKRRALLTSLDQVAKKAIAEAVDREVKPALTKSFELVVADWKNKPEFRTRKTIKAESIGLTIFPYGENAEIWKYVDLGTKPHVIRPVRAKVLRFKTGYSPKTLPSPARTVSGGGVASGPEVVAKEVNHPGSKARDFTGTIARDILPDFKRIIENTFRQISRMMEE